ncbi:hypothetical protein JOS77_21620 [Chromobacterium haemolyticum]|nr:hypothetical protein JOS77_21620 [Chromobacterium haemolyticum]
MLLDEVRLRQVVGNLVSNAIRYTDSGSVTVSVSCLRATGHHELVLQVRDTGVGIPPEYQQRIFQPFIQGKHRRAGSCGLGLSIVKELVNLFGGCIARWTAPRARAPASPCAYRCRRRRRRARSRC